MSTTIEHMPAPRKNKPETHKPRRMVGIPEAFAVAMEAMADAEFSTLTDQVRMACKEYLEKRDKLPKPPKPRGSA